MGIFDFLKKTPERIAESGNALFAKGQYAMAVQEYEKAMDRHCKEHSATTGFEKKITGKIAEAKNALAAQHMKNAGELMESRCFEDARELLNLVREIAVDHSLQIEAQKRLLEIRDALPIRKTDPDLLYTDEDDPDFGDDAETDTDDAEYATALINTLPKVEQEAYLQYGENFLVGFSALNQGDFYKAAEYLEKAIEENKNTRSYIPLELATCYLNLGKHEDAERLLVSFLSDFPFSARGYQVLCETLWEVKEYDRALAVLASCPEELAGAVLMVIMTGETLREAGRYVEAVAVLEKYLKQTGSNELVIRALAKTYQEMGEAGKAVTLYSSLLDQCKSCGRKADPDLKRQYADSAFSAGRHTLDVLEIYLELAEVEPENRKNFYKKVSDIYRSLGNEGDALRFRELSTSGK